MDPTLFPFLDPLTFAMLGGATQPGGYPGSSGMIDRTAKGDPWIPQAAAPTAFQASPQPVPTSQVPAYNDGYYGGSPADNPNLKPIGAPAAPGSTDLSNKLTAAARGVQVPAPPQPQRVSTPGQNRPVAAIKSGELLQLLALLAAQGQGASPGLDLPNSLGVALGGRR